MKQRLAAFKKQNWDLYTGKINEASQDFYTLSRAEMEFALNILDITVENYMTSIKKVMETPGIAEQCNKRDLELRARLDHKELTNSRAELKQIYIQLKQDEQEIEYLDIQQGSNQFQVLIEKTKLYDALYLKHDFKVHQLNTAVEKMKIAEDLEVLEIVNAHAMRKQNTAKRLADENIVSDFVK